MSNTLLESLWARVSANIGDRIDQISELLTQALSASAESKAARDAAAASASEAESHAERAELATDITGLRNEVTQQIAAVVDGSPAALDTIREVAEYAQANRGITDQLNAAIGNKADKSHTHTTSQVTGLDNALSGKAAKSHTHTTSEITGLEDALANKSDDRHRHHWSDVTGVASKSYVDSRPALFSGSGAPPSSIDGAVVGDWWLNTSTMELHKITGV